MYMYCPNCVRFYKGDPLTPCTVCGDITEEAKLKWKAWRSECREGWIVLEVQTEDGIIAILVSVPKEKVALAERLLLEDLSLRVREEEKDIEDYE